MAPTPASPPAPSGNARLPDQDPRFESGTDADSPGSAGGWLRALVFLVLGAGLLGVGFWAIKPKPGVGLQPTPMAPTSTPVVVAPSDGMVTGPVPASASASSPAPAPTPATPTDTAPAPMAGAASPPPATATIARGTLIGNPMDLRLTQGEVAHLSLTTDVPGELHLHGYDLERPTKAGQPTELSFTASHTGRFPVEWHGPGHRHVDVGVVEVYPP